MHLWPYLVGTRAECFAAVRVETATYPGYMGCHMPQQLKIYWKPTGHYTDEVAYSVRSSYEQQKNDFNDLTIDQRERIIFFVSLTPGRNLL